MENPDIEKIKARLARLEEAVFGMDYETADNVVTSYVEALKENPELEASPAILN